MTDTMKIFLLCLMVLLAPSMVQGEVGRGIACDMPDIPKPLNDHLLSFSLQAVSCARVEAFAVPLPSQQQLQQAQEARQRPLRSLWPKASATDSRVAVASLRLSRPRLLLETPTQWLRPSLRPHLEVSTTAAAAEGMAD